MCKIKSFDQLMEGVKEPQNKAQLIFKNHLLNVMDKDVNTDNLSNLLLNVMRSYIESYGEIKDEISENLKRWIVFFMVNDLEVKKEIASGDIELEDIYSKLEVLTFEERDTYNNYLEIDNVLLAIYLLELKVKIKTVAKATNLNLETVEDLYYNNYYE